MESDVYGDVGVVGGGPAGLYCATQLARYGFKTLLFEEHASVADRVLCTGIISTDAFRELSLPREPIVGRLSSIKAISHQGTELSYACPQPLAYIVDKGAFNRALAAGSVATGAPIIYLHPRSADSGERGLSSPMSWRWACGFASCTAGWAIGRSIAYETRSLTTGSST